MTQTMYPAINNSPQTTTTSQITASATEIPVADISKLPAPPNIATLGVDDDAELVRYNGITGSALTGCERGFNSTTARVWAAETLIYRGFTAYDHDAFRANLGDLDAKKLDKTGDASDVTATFTVAAAKANISTGEKLSIVLGKLGKWFTSFGGAAWLNVGAGAGEVAAGNHTHTQYLTTESDPTVSAWAKAEQKPTYTHAEVGADPSGAAAAVQANLSSHVADADNPHGVTAAQVGAAAISHAHGSIAGDGKIGADANLPLFTGHGGAIRACVLDEAKTLLGVGRLIVSITKTLSAASWVNQQQTVSDAAIYSAVAPGDVRIAQGASDAAFEAWVAARPRVYSQDVGSIVVRVTGTVPAVDIPIVVEVRE